ncbi:MAG: hypothetical protein CMB80_22615 [Flammeovirgaceae bacterium]|nr:hypothetical protein [Flammeovirgaceae bacterium]
MPNIEFKEGPFITKMHEFKYSETDVGVRKDQEYFTYRLDNKKTEHRLKSNSELIVRKLKSMIEQYKKAKPDIARDGYPKEVFPSSKNLNFKNKFIKRIFAKSVLREQAPIVEVESVTNAKSYIFVTIDWQIGGTVKSAELFNKKSLLKVKNRMPELLIQIPLLQLHESKFSDEVSNRRLLRADMYAQTNAESSG